MFTVKLSPPQKMSSLEPVCLEVRDPSLSRIIHKSTTQGAQDVLLELDGNKYDNKLEYRFTPANFNDTVSASVNFYPIAPGGIAAALNLLDPSANDNFDIDVLIGAAPTEISYFMRNILSRAYHKVLLKPDKQVLKNYSNFLEMIGSELIDKHDEIRYVHQLLWVLTSYINRCMSRGVHIEKLNESTVDRLITNYCRSFGMESTEADIQPGLLVAKGHLMSLSNREIASKVYLKAREIGLPFLESFLRVDALTTYFSDVTAGYDPAIIEKTSIYKNDKKINMCFSVDPKYFRMYAPLWASVSAFYPDIIFNYVLVTESENEFDQLSSEYENLVTNCDSLVGLNKGSNVRLFWMENSKSYGRTLFACARFYLAKKILMESNGDVFVCDIDQFVIGDLSKFLKNVSMKPADVQLAIVENYFALLPGRSHLAGYIYMKNSKASESFISDVTDYIAEGMGVDYSWMLDQNAVRYAAERTPISHLDMRSQRVFGHYGAHKNALRVRLP